jgi:hypothetical protein
MVLYAAMLVKERLVRDPLQAGGCSRRNALSGFAAVIITQVVLRSCILKNHTPCYRDTRHDNTESRVFSRVRTRKVFICLMLRFPCPCGDLVCPSRRRCQNLRDAQGGHSALRNLREGKLSCARVQTPGDRAAGIRHCCGSSPAAAEILQGRKRGPCLVAEMDACRLRDRRADA